MRYCEAVKGVVIKELVAHDVRFPTSLTLAGSDAVHTSPDYSCGYAILRCEGTEMQGHGLTFTCGRGTDLVADAIRAYGFLVEGVSLVDIVCIFELGPEKGTVHLALAAVINAIWDLWAKLEGKPLWKLVADMTPEEFVSVVDFRYMTDVVTEEEALGLLRAQAATKGTREVLVRQDGVPAYITSVGWMGYADEKIKDLCKGAIEEGWTHFKMKVGVSVEDDIRRAGVIRSVIGEERKLMMDANQDHAAGLLQLRDAALQDQSPADTPSLHEHLKVWDVPEAISWTHKLAQFNPWWMEEPTSPDDVLGHGKIAKAINPLGIGVATGEHCQNRVVFKQLLESKAVQFCQIDACRLGGVNEVLAVLLLAAKTGVPVCPHAGGVGLCELVRHLAVINFICLVPSWENTYVEFADHLHEHFKDPAVVRKAHYVCPTMSGYSAELKEESLEAHTFPNGARWVQLAKEGKSQYH